MPCYCSFSGPEHLAVADVQQLVRLERALQLALWVLCSMVSAPVASVGERALVETFSATVKYVGHIDGQSGLWVGLEWDDPARGKHDGSVAGRQYFTCSGTSGSFVKLDKFLRISKKGKTLLEALTDRYCAIEAPDEEGLSFPTVSSKQLQVKLIGRDRIHARQSQLEFLKAASLARESICSVGPKGELASVAPQLSEVDLSGNALGSWPEIAKLAEELPKLYLLNLSCCGLAVPQQLSNLKDFSRLQTLVLNATGLSWLQVQQLEPYLPVLSQLHLCSNSLQGPTSPLQGFKHLQVLSLDDNALHSWSSVAVLGLLPALQRLLLGQNGLQNIDIPNSGQHGPSTFRSLEALLLADNNITAWSSVDALDHFPRLQEARLTGNPIFAEAHAGARSEVIARIGALSRLNGSTISAAERKDAELQYLRTVTGQLEEAGSSSSAAAQLQEAHPRLAVLQSRYGQVGSAIVDRTRGSIMRSGMVELTLTCSSKKTTHTKRLPGSMTVGRLKVLCERLFKISASAQVLTLHEVQSGNEMCMSEDEGRTLSFFDIQGPAMVHIDEIDLTAIAAAAQHARKAAADAHEQRMQQHDKDIDLMKSIQQQQFGVKS